ncbi:hypothetical protein LK996_15600 [Lysobacter sp. A6]|uniref:HTH merR-type domain-containing protein n=1 Tax=Noviluteimonas lactosilytica TaxID=2888523 RepID=A0ABS8JLL3_9GAMM|nr:hypothetical protein [Lysobacter lactosilyticus]MCC8364496.1 hypothetical protein [Lysobacter lactosilyticus]
MAREEWSENALADELQIDRRTLGRRLEGLRPVRTKRLKSREERFYRLADVLRHLGRVASASGDTERPLKRWAAEQLFPALFAGDFMLGAIGYFTSDLKLTRAQAVRAHLDLCLIAMSALDDLAREKLEFAIPQGLLRDALEADSAGALDAFVAKHWGGP